MPGAKSAYQRKHMLPRAQKVDENPTTTDAEPGYPSSVPSWGVAMQVHSSPERVSAAEMMSVS